MTKKDKVWLWFTWKLSWFMQLTWSRDLAFLSFQFHDLKSAEKFYIKWRDELDQEFPYIGLFSMRSMACHISDVLEGRKRVERYGLTNCILTKYGPHFYGLGYD